MPDLSSNEFMTMLYLDGNRLSGTLADLSGAGQRDIHTLNLNYNKISGEIPDLSRLSSLAVFYIAHNSLNGTLANLSTLSKRQDKTFLGIDLGGNNLSGTITDLSFLTNSGYTSRGPRLAHTLSLYGNNLSGSLPDMSSFPGMEVIDLADNNFTGSVGDLGGSSGDLSVFSTLWILDVSGNSLTGEIPASDKLPQTVEYLQLNDNRLSGSVPNLSDLTKLKALGLWGNPDLDLMGIHASRRD